MAGGPLLIAYDGTPPSERAIRDAAELLGQRRALVTVVRKAALAFELLEPPGATLNLPPAPIDIRTALQIHEQTSEAARRMAQHGAQIAREAGHEAEPLTVAEEPGSTIAETLVRVARERGAPAIAMGLHGHGRRGPLIVGSITDYPLGIVKVLPFKAHLAIDAMGALALAATPFVTGQWNKGRDQWLPHAGLCMFELVSLAMTDPTQKGDSHGDVDAVRRANTEDPHHKVYERAPAVARARAMGA
jgi:nucleotide-binding universal stress UspA family protein